jgi:hypothetical protein
LLRLGVVPDCEIRNIKVVREVLPSYFKLKIVRFDKEHWALVFDAHNSRSRANARNAGWVPHRDIR